MNRVVTFEAHPVSDARSTVGQTTPGRRMAVATLCGLFAAAGFLIGAVSGLQRSVDPSHARGACIALEFAENFGAVGVTQKRQAMHAMSTSAGRHHGLFPKSIAEFEDLCIRTWTSEVRLGR